MFLFVKISEENERKKTNKKRKRNQAPRNVNKDKGKCKPTTSSKTQKKRKFINGEDEDDDSTNEIMNEDDLCDESSNDDWNTFCKKQLGNQEKEEEESELVTKLQPIYKHKGSFVLIKYHDNFYPGVIENVEEEGATVSAMKKTVKDHWKWPEEKFKDELFYSWEDIVGGINPPKML